MIKVSPLHVEPPFVEIYLDETIHNFEKTDEEHFSAYYSNAVKCKDCGLVGWKARFQNLVIVDENSAHVKNCNGKKVAKKVDDEESENHRPCYICERTKNGHWQHVKVGKKKHLICSQCYLANMPEIRETGGIARRRKKEDGMAKKKVEKGGKKKSDRPTIMGFAITAVLRFLGSKGVSTQQAKALMAKLNVPIADATVSIQINAGRNGQRGDPAKLTKDQAQELLAKVPKVKEEPKKEAEKKTAKKKTAKKKKK